jgi:hypothetical protein
MNIKILFTGIGLGVLCQTALAGGPEIEMEKAHIDQVVEMQGGIVVLRVTGSVKLYVPDVEGDHWVTLPMKSGELRYLGDELHAVSYEGSKRYEQRIQDMKGTEQLFQMWGTVATVQGGRVTHITARLVGPLIPVKGERRFAQDLVEELTELPKPK